MQRPSLPDMRPWGRRPLTFPPSSAQAWIRLAMWEMWMGVLVCIVVGLGVTLVATSPDRILSVADLTNCYAAPPVPIPCERIVYRGGALNAAFTALCGALLIGMAAWLIWELWGAVEPKPITDDFLRLLHDSFGRNWRNPLTWPWPRLLWAYGFALIGASLTAAIAITIWATVASTQAAKPTIGRVDTSQSFRIGQ
jgi:hypothetical protein